MSSSPSLSVALNVVLSSPLSEEQCSALTAKIKETVEANQIDEVIAKATAAHEEFVSKKWTRRKLFHKVKTPLSAWVIVWQYSNNMEHGRGTYRARLSKSQRELVDRSASFSDLTSISAVLFDLIFLLAYAEVGPQGVHVLEKVYSRCTDFAATGTKIRSLIEPFMEDHKRLELMLVQSGKRPLEVESEENSEQFYNNLWIQAND